MPDSGEHDQAILVLKNKTKQISVARTLLNLTDPDEQIRPLSIWSVSPLRPSSLAPNFGVHRPNQNFR